MLRAAIAMFCLSVSATPAAQVFKCIDKGKVTYSEAPCPGAQVTRLELQPSAPPAPALDQQAELQRQKALADKLASARHTREERHARERARASREAAVRYQRCARLRLQKKWADEDARNARDGEQSRTMRTKADRAAESLKVECPG